MYLVIAEKPSVSQAIAEVIGVSKREEGYLKGKDCIVSWCFGHLRLRFRAVCRLSGRSHFWCSAFSILPAWRRSLLSSGNWEENGR